MTNTIQIKSKNKIYLVINIRIDVEYLYWLLQMDISRNWVFKKIVVFENRFLAET